MSTLFINTYELQRRLMYSSRYLIKHMDPLWNLFS